MNSQPEPPQRHRSRGRTSRRPQGLRRRRWRRRRTRRGQRRVRARVVHRRSWARRDRARARSCTWRPASTAPRPAPSPRGHRARRAERATADDPAARADRVRLPGVQPDAVAHGHAEHRPAAAPRRSPPAARGGARGRRARRAGASGCATAPPSSRAASSSASRSPGRSSRGPRSCSPTSRPARSTPAPGAACSRSCATSSTRDGHTVVMVTHDPVAAAHADRVLLLADGRIAGMLDAPSADEVAEQLAHLGS